MILASIRQAQVAWHVTCAFSPEQSDRTDLCLQRALIKTSLYMYICTRCIVHSERCPNERDLDTSILQLVHTNLERLQH
jgi:hypothetical protein